VSYRHGMNVLGQRQKPLPLLGMKPQVIQLIALSLYKMSYFGCLCQCSYMHIKMAVICTAYLLLLLEPREMLSFRIKHIFTEIQAGLNLCQG